MSSDQAARPTGHPELDVLLDPVALAGAVGRADLRVTRLRYKPGVYAVAALTNPRRPWGWIRVSVDPRRGIKDQTRAKGAGTVHHRRLPGGLWASHGPFVTDPRLGEHLLDSDRDAQVVRHNPLRRLVLRRGEDLVRVSAEPQPDLGWLSEDAAEVVGLPRGRSSEHRTSWSWVPGRPLDASPRADAGAGAHLGPQGMIAVPGAVSAGRALARWHTMTPPMTDGRVPRRRPSTDGLVAGAASLGTLDRDLARRMHELLSLLPHESGPGRALLHGDFSADQVIVSEGDGGARLIDLDRVCVGDPVHDLGSFAAVEALRTADVSGGRLLEELRAGYTQLAPWPSAADLRAAQARSLLSRALEPLRRGEHAWREGIGRTLDLAAEVSR